MKYRRIRQPRDADGPRLGSGRVYEGKEGYGGCAGTPSVVTTPLRLPLRFEPDNAIHRLPVYRFGGVGRCVVVDRYI